MFNLRGNVPQREVSLDHNTQERAVCHSLFKDRSSVKNCWLIWQITVLLYYGDRTYERD